MSSFHPSLIFSFFLSESPGLPSFHHSFHHLAFLPPPCYVYSSSASVQFTVTRLSVFVQARVENKTPLYPSSCKPNTALTSSEKPDSQSVRQTGRQEHSQSVNHSASQKTRLPVCHLWTQTVGQWSSCLPSQRTNQSATNLTSQIGYSVRKQFKGLVS